MSYAVPITILNARIPVLVKSRTIGRHQKSKTPMHTAKKNLSTASKVVFKAVVVVVVVVSL